MIERRKNPIVFNKPYIAGRELFNIANAVIGTGQLAGDGFFTKKCQKWLQESLCCQKALLTHSCTGALEMAAILSDIQPGDEVIMPSYTFVSTANAFVLRGGIPVFVDIRSDTLNIDESLIEKAVTPKTKVIVPVHYAGVPCEMDSICQLSKQYNLFVVEDAAQALMSSYNSKKLGTIGHLGALSFHETKNIISGEGGALLINDRSLIDRAEIIWEKGTNRKKFFRNEIDKYTWVDIGSSYLPGEIIAAFLSAQFEQADEIIINRQNSVKYYLKLLEAFCRDKGVLLPVHSSELEGNGHLMYIITRSSKERASLITFLQDRNIAAVFHYSPLHSSPAGQKFGKKCGTLAVTDDMSARILRLPLFYKMEKEQIERVVESIIDFYEKK